MISPKSLMNQVPLLVRARHLLRWSPLQWKMSLVSAPGWVMCTGPSCYPRGSDSSDVIGFEAVCHHSSIDKNVYHVDTESPLVAINQGTTKLGLNHSDLKSRMP